MSNLSRSFSKHLSSVMTGFGGLAKIDVIQTQETLSLDRGEEVREGDVRLDLFEDYLAPCAPQGEIQG